jgi:Zn-dependent alcohol dehydrogenase
MMSNNTEPKAVAAAPRTKRVAQMTAFRRPFQVVELPVAAPRADGAVVRVEASGVCRTTGTAGIRTWDGSQPRAPRKET